MIDYISHNMMRSFTEPDNETSPAATSTTDESQASSLHELMSQGFPLEDEEYINEPQEPSSKSSSSSYYVQDEEGVRILVRDGAYVKPKRILTAYNIFFQDERRKMLESNNSENHQDTIGTDSKKKKIGFANMARTVSARWKMTDQATRQHYLQLSAQDKIRHAREIAAWRRLEMEMNQKFPNNKNNQDDDVSTDNQCGDSKKKKRKSKTKKRKSCKSMASSQSSESKEMNDSKATKKLKQGQTCASNVIQQAANTSKQDDAVNSSSMVTQDLGPSMDLDRREEQGTVIEESERYSCARYGGSDCSYSSRTGFSPPPISCYTGVGGFRTGYMTDKPMLLSPDSKTPSPSLQLPSIRSPQLLEFMPRYPFPPPPSLQQVLQQTRELAASFEGHDNFFSSLVPRAHEEENAEPKLHNKSYNETDDADFPALTTNGEEDDLLSEDDLASIDMIPSDPFSFAKQISPPFVSMPSTVSATTIPNQNGFTYSYQGQREIGHCSVISSQSSCGSLVSLPKHQHRQQQYDYQGSVKQKQQHQEQTFWGVHTSGAGFNSTLTGNGMAIMPQQARSGFSIQDLYTSLSNKMGDECCELFLDMFREQNK